MDKVTSDSTPVGALDTRQKGRSGEDIAAEYLISKGYAIISRNYQRKNGEIDCIARDPDGTLAFIEVKSSYGSSFAHPFSWISRGKQRSIARLAQQYLAEHDLMRAPCRFDAIAIVNGKVDHMKNAFIRM